jgi:hypothetical protein
MFMIKEKRIGSVMAVALMSAMLVVACGKISLPTLMVIDPAVNNTMTIQLPASFGGGSVTSKIVGNVKTTVILDTNKLISLTGTPATVRVDSFLTAGTSINLGSIASGTLCTYVPAGEEAGGVAKLDPLLTQRATFQLTIPTETLSVSPVVQQLLPPIPLLLEINAKSKITLTSMITLLLKGTGLNMHQVVNTTIPTTVPLLGGSTVALDTTMTSTKTPVTDPLLTACENLVTDPAHYVAVADDGVKVQLRRYRPSLNDEFRIGKQPVVLFSGILSNMNYFLVSTPEEQKSAYSAMTLPSAVADWAFARDTNGNIMYDANGKPVLESHIAEDPMKYYSLAHYLWLMGYDPWFGNYRNTGRLNYRTESGTVHNVYITALDSWITLDAPAAIAKVTSVTGLKPVIGGHSTGGFCTYGYLEGTYMDDGGAANKAAAYKAAYDAGYLPHVKGDAVLAQLRNSSVKGLILMDPAGQPPEPAYFDQPVIWQALGLKMYIPLDELEESVSVYWPIGTMLAVTDAMYNGMDQLIAVFKAMGVPDYYNMFRYSAFWDLSDTDRYVEDFIGRYGLSSSSIRCLAQYYDNGMHLVTRENWKNGAENKDLVEGPTPNPGHDGYYYYSENYDKITSPTIAILSDRGALVDPNLVITTLMAKKTANPLDEIHVIQDTAHADLVIGLKGPVQVFPAIGAWLEKVSAP